MRDNGALLIIVGCVLALGWAGLVSAEEDGQRDAAGFPLAPSAAQSGTLQEPARPETSGKWFPPDLCRPAFIENSDRVGRAPDGSYYEKKSLRPLSPEEACRLAREERRAEKHYLRAAAQIGFFLALGTIHYYLDQQQNEQDWEYGWDWDNWRRRLTGTSFRFDNNDPYLNVYHAYDGAFFYWLARSNGLNLAESFLYVLSASTVWEILAEYREKPSLNDQIITTFGGLPLGESWYQLGEFFNRGAPTLTNRLLGVLFGGPKVFNYWWDDKKMTRAKRFDALGFPADTWHRFDLYLGCDLSRPPSKEESWTGAGQAGFQAQLFKEALYDKPGQIRRLLLDTPFSEVSLHTGFREKSIFDFRLFAKVLPGGYYQQDTEKNEQDSLNGYTVLVGPSFSLDYRDWIVSDRSGLETKDWYFIVNLLGASSDISIYDRDLKVRLNLDVSWDFGMVRSTALPVYNKENGLEGLRTVLQKEGYFYGQGLTGAGALTVSYRGFEAGSRITYHYLNSLEGRDRFQEQVTRDLKMSEHITVARMWLSHPLYGKHLRVEYAAEYTARRGTLDRFLTEEVAMRYEGRLVLRF